MKCKYCGRETSGSYTMCHSCMQDFTTMRNQIWDYHEKKYGKLTPENLKLRQKDSRRLSNVWKKNPEKFQEIIQGEV